MDHCHYYKQTGKHELEILHKVWLNSIPDCMIKLEKFDLLENVSDGKRRAHIWYTGSGTFARDLMDTKATGKEVKYPGTVDFLFDEKGKIVSSDEWMSNIFYKLPPLDYRYVSDLFMRKSFLIQIAVFSGTQPLRRLRALLEIRGGYYRPVLQLSSDRGVRASLLSPTGRFEIKCSHPSASRVHVSDSQEKLQKISRRKSRRCCYHSPNNYSVSIYLFSIAIFVNPSSISIQQLANK